MIKAQDIVDSVAEAFQFISYYHPKDFLDALHNAYELEESKPAKDALAQILTNSKMSATDKRPLCQDTGIATVFVTIGQKCILDTSKYSIEELINEGVRCAYLNEDNPLRASVLKEPYGSRVNTRDNTPAVIHCEFDNSSEIDFICAAKGGGSEAKAKLFMLNPSDSISDTIVESIPSMGAGWCPPGILGVGIGGTPEKAMLLAKKSLMSPVNMLALLKAGPKNKSEELRLELYHRINSLGIGAQGLGGVTTVLDVKLLEYPTHAANLPVGIIPNCAATRHIHFCLDGTGPATFTPPRDNDYPSVNWKPDFNQAKKVELSQLTKETIKSWKAGDQLLLSGLLLTGRDAAHKRIMDFLDQKTPLPVNFKNRIIYYVGPVDPVRDEAVGPAGPTTATRMDKFTERMLEETGLLGMIGKAERGIETVNSIKKHKSVYLIGVGGAAYLVSKAIKKATLVAFEDLGMEAIYEFEVEDMPVTVAVDNLGNSVHDLGPAKWKIKLESV
ncbi:MAG: fumarate hydratase [Betaproteobacteria bacterium TMED82]|nr:MAG: fumarate hydratase [Betaproteobacteria bacterium TMED82]|tara:strand:- start:4882 stop:6384 length:1503 start_codon:yes stop_codon:yes gene_type:complete